MTAPTNLNPTPPAREEIVTRIFTPNLNAADQMEYVNDFQLTEAELASVLIKEN